MIELREQMIEEGEEPSFAQRHTGLIAVVIILGIGTGIFFAARTISSSAPAAARGTVVTIVPHITATPTPSVTPQPTPEQSATPDQVHAVPTVIPFSTPSATKPADAPKRPGDLKTTINSPNGNQISGLTNGPDGNGSIGSDDTGNGGTLFGQYFSAVQNSIAAALRNNPRTRRESMNVIVRIWPDATGRITKALVSGGADASLDATVQNDILTGLQLAEPPPADLHLPIVLRLTAQRPH